MELKEEVLQYLSDIRICLGLAEERLDRYGHQDLVDKEFRAIKGCVEKLLELLK